MSKNPPKPRYLNLDDAEQDGLVLIVRHRDAMASVTRARLAELLDAEAAWLEHLAGGAPAGEPRRHKRLAPVEETISILEEFDRKVPLEKVSHASLSSRIKKVYTYSKATRRIRPAHAGLIAEVLEGFDGTIPHHANPLVEAHLSEFCEWEAVPDALKAQIHDFLHAYRKNRQAAS